MTAREHQFDDVGIVFEAELLANPATALPLDISAATTLELLFQTPDGVLKTKTAVLSTDGTDGKLRYITVASDLDKIGTWRWQAHVAGPGYDLHSAVRTFAVLDNLT
jgi:hypothetical protein